MRRWSLYVTVVLLLIAAAAALYFLTDPERLELNDAVRQSAPGRFVRLTDGYTHYELAGPPTGRVVVLAAGYSVPYYIWDPTVAALAGAGYNVLRYDYYGRGYSDRPDTPFKQDLYVRQLAELLDALHIAGPLDLAGLSFGGSVITSFADRYPARVRSLIYFDPGFRSPGVAPPLSSIPFLWNYYAAVFEERSWAEGQASDFLHPEQFPDWAARYRVQLQYRGFRRARLSEIVNNIDVDQGAELERVGKNPRPVLVIWGKEDQTVPFQQSVLLMERMPRARLIPVESSGHLPQLEQPDIVNPVLLEFLQRAH